MVLKQKLESKKLAKGNGFKTKTYSLKKYAK